MFLSNSTAMPFVGKELLLLNGNASSIPLNKQLHSSYCSTWLIGSMIVTIFALLILALWCQCYRSQKRRNLLMYNEKYNAPYCMYLPLTFHHLNNFWNPEDNESTYLIPATRTKPRHYRKFIINMRNKKSQFKSTRVKRKFSYFVSIPETEEEHDYHKVVN